MVTKDNEDINNAEHDESINSKRVTSISGDGESISASNPTPVGFGDSPSIDAFARARISQPETLFDSKQIFDKQPLFWDDQQVTGSGTTSTWSQNTASTVLAVSNLTAGRRVRQTFMRPNYQPGKSQLIFMTGTLGNGGGGVGITRCMGQYDDNNGIFMQDDQGVVKAVIRSNYTGTPVDTKVAQTSWNIDTLDGSGKSGITLDGSKSQILIMDYEWLGVGRVRIGFVFDGIPVYVHQFNHANIRQGVYMSTPNNPLRYEIENDGTGAAADLEHVCASVISEGGTQKLGVLRHNDSPTITALGSATSYIMMAGRLKSTHLGMNIDVESLSLVASSTNDFCHWELVAGGTYAGTLTFADFPDSGVQIAPGAKTNVFNNDGLAIDGGFFASTLPSTISLLNALKLGAAIDGTPQEFYIVVTPITNNINVTASITWREFN